MIDILTRVLFGFLAAIVVQPGSLSAEAVAVRYPEGTVHGFLALRDSSGKVLAAGDLIQIVHGDRVVSELMFRFKDGSIDEDTATFSQRGVFRLVSDHHVQKGPIFPISMDSLISVSTGQVTVRYRDKDRDKIETAHLELPPDLANGIVPDILKNIPSGTSEVKLSYVAATPKPRLVRLSIASQGEDTFWIAGLRHKATRFVVKAELGGIAGLIAPLIGKQPADTKIWIGDGEAPEFVKSEGQQYVGGPIWSIELASPVWGQPLHSEH